ncbi:tetratricopeptide repeat protein 23 isoform X1 [Brachyistius frenatus]|uniref:tetratricopeptide repeat protein 23 isoform X1 n=2 Tax=Brachyistius frenatus TaxID=100188 RepID=UPI0037E824D5
MTIKQRINHDQNSSVSPTKSSESMGSSNRGVDVFPDCGSDVVSPSQTGCAKKEFMMMPPEEKLKHFDSRAQASEDNQEYDACIQDLVRCVALTRLVYGEGHLKLAQAHARMAQAYFQFKGWGLQAQKHLTLARELLSFCSSISCRGDKLEALACLMSVHLTQGGASLLTDNLKEVESSFLEAEQVLEELHQHNVINQEVKIKTQLDIYSGLCRVYKRQNRPEEALSQCEKSLQLLKDCNKPEKTCSVYRDMAAIEQDTGHLDRAIEHLSKAHAIAMSHSPKKLEGARISHSLALMLSAAAEPHHNDSAGHYFEQSLSAYKSSVGPQDPAFLAAQDDFCRFLLMKGQQERAAPWKHILRKFVEIQRASLGSKRSAFGDLSPEVADTLQLIGSVEMAESRMNQAHRTMTKCLKIQILLNGPQHRKTKAIQQAVDMLARAPEVAERLQRQGRRKTKPHTFLAVSSSGNDENCMSDS